VLTFPSRDSVTPVLEEVPVSRSREPLKLAFVVRSLGVGGAERQLVTLSAGLARRGHDVTLLVLSHDLSQAGPLRDTSVRVIVLEKPSRWHIGKWLPQLRSELSMPGLSAVCGWMPGEALIAFGARPMRAVPFIWSVRCSTVDPRDYDWLTNAVFRAHKTLVRAGFGDAIVFNSYAGVDEYRLDPSVRRVAVLWNGVDSERFRPSTELREVGRRTLGVEDQRVVTMIGRLVPCKDHQTFVRAACRIAAVVPDATFLMIGDGSIEERERLAAIMADSALGDRLRWHAQVADVTALLNASDVVVSTSRDSEGVQNSVIEAMVSGRPVVATDVGDVRRYRSPLDSLTAPGDDVSIAEEVMRQLASDTEENRRQRRAHAEQLFGVERMCREFEDFVYNVRQ
jgi:glycosyltransferase involved in cell wall biosynthesis